MIINNLKCVFHDKEKMSPTSGFYSVLKGFVMAEFTVLFLNQINILIET